MSYCSSCGAALGAENTKFCSSCGKPTSTITETHQKNQDSLNNSEITKAQIRIGEAKGLRNAGFGFILLGGFSIFVSKMMSIDDWDHDIYVAFGALAIVFGFVMSLYFDRKVVKQLKLIKCDEI